MGFFSFITTDTNKSIPNIHSNNHTFTVYLIDDEGNEFAESNYDGYGNFGGKDIYELIAEMNGYSESDLGKTRAELDIDCGEHWHNIKYGELRSIGVDLFFKFGKDCYLPQIYTKSGAVYNDDAEPLRDCPFQGYFY